MRINYWKCPYNDYEEFYSDGEEMRLYGCKHPNNIDFNPCEPDNKYAGMKAECQLLDGEVNNELKKGANNES